MPENFVPSPYLRGLTLALAGVLLLGPDALLVRLADQTGVAEATFFRSAFLALGWGVLLAARRRGDVLGALRGLSFTSMIASLVLAADILFFVLALNKTSVANTLVIMATVPMFAAILGLVLLREGIRRDLQFCIAASFIGVAVTFGGSVGVGSPVGDLFAVATALFYALYLVLLRLEDRNVVLETLLLAGVTAAVLTLPFADPLSVPPADVTILAIQCGLLLPIAFALFFSGVNYLPPAEVALIGLLETVLGPVWVWVFLGEAPGAAALSGGALVVLAVVWSAITGSRPTAPSTAGITGSR